MHDQLPTCFCCPGSPIAHDQRLFGTRVLSTCLIYFWRVPQNARSRHVRSPTRDWASGRPIRRSALLFSIEKDAKKMVGFLIEKGADPHLAGYIYSEDFGTGPEYHSYVHTAIRKGHTAMCKMFVEELNVRPEQEHLDLARKMENQEVVDFFLVSLIMMYRRSGPFLRR